jgi:phosphopantothenoylcysteine decarboxylase/phosphopantothenate--cysteine ligase
MARVVLGVGGGIAAYKAVALARALVEDGHALRVVPTDAALEFVGRTTWEAISGGAVTADVFENAVSVDHVQLAKEADLVIVAPATADLLAKAACGLAADLLGATLLGAQGPVIMAPAMHTSMLEHPATQANIETLRSRGIIILDSPVGRLTSGDVGAGRMAEVEDIMDAVQIELDRSKADMSGVRVVISAGGTREALDPVRYLGNASSGKQGFALARAAVSRGAEVALVAANVDLATPVFVRRADVVSAAELERAMATLAPSADIIIQAAAVADYRPTQTAQTKLKRDALGDNVSLELVANPDILAELVAGRAAGQVVVGFAAETGDDMVSAQEHARAKAMRKGADLTVFNVVGADVGFGQDTNDVIIFDAQGEAVERAEGSKASVADAILDASMNVFGAKGVLGGKGGAPVV